MDYSNLKVPNHVALIVDGNGRTSRLLMNLDLMNQGFNPVIIKKEDVDRHNEPTILVIISDISY